MTSAYCLEHGQLCFIDVLLREVPDNHPLKATAEVLERGRTVRVAVRIEAENSVRPMSGSTAICASLFPEVLISKLGSHHLHHLQTGTGVTEFLKTFFGCLERKAISPINQRKLVQNPPNLRMQCSSALHSSQTQANKLASKSNQRNSLNYDFRRGIKRWYQDEDHLITEIIAALIAPKTGLKFLYNLHLSNLARLRYVYILAMRHSPQCS